MIDTTTLALRASVATMQIRKGCEALYAGDTATAEACFCTARAELRAILAAFETEPPPPRKPMRRLALVGGTDKLEPWMERKHGEPDDGAA